MNYEDLMYVAFCDNDSVLELTDRLCMDVVENGIEGDFAECGCAYGAHGIIMNHNSNGKKVYLFDSFEGIPTHSEEDVEWTQSYGKGLGDPRRSGGITVCKLEDVKYTMGKFVPNFDNIVFVKGWFVDTLPKLTDEKFSILRLDCDLYNSYKTCLKYMLPRLSDGGWLIIDDYSLAGCRQALAEAGFKESDFQFANSGQIAYLKFKK